MNAHNELNKLSPVNFLAHTLLAEDRRVELGLPDGASVCVARWLVTRDGLRTQGVAKARRWAVDNMGSLQAAIRTIRASTKYSAWVRGEKEQAAKRGESLG